MPLADKSNKPRQSKDSGKRPVKSKAEIKDPVVSKTDNKPYHKEQLKAATESMYKYPYLNLSLGDMDGEIWKPFPVEPFDEYYMVSNKGRVKRLEREVVRQDKRGFQTNYKLEEAIQKIRKTKYDSPYTRRHNYQLMVALRLNGAMKIYKLSRIIYHTFVAPIEEPKFEIIEYKDHDQLNCMADNLYMISKKEKMNRVRKNVIEVMRREEWTTEQIKERNYIRDIAVSKYDSEGRYITTYPNIKKAAIAEKIDNMAIVHSFTKKWKMGGNFYWREGRNKQNLAFPEINRLKNQHEVLNQQKRKVLQYDSRGKLYRVYSTIKEAAQTNNIPKSTISYYLEGRKAIYKDYIWKYAETFEIIPEQLDLENIPLPEVEKIIESREELGFPLCEYPYRDMYPGNLEGEIWKGVVGYEKLYQVSNMGRVKRLQHYAYRSDKKISLASEQMIRQRKRRFGQNKKYMVLSFGLNKGRSITSLSIPRAVYEAFVAPIDKNNNWIIAHHDSNPLNNRIENLYLTPVADIRKPSDNGIHISQYDMEGNLLNRFTSISEASRVTGINHHSLFYYFAKKNKPADFLGFIWKKEEVPQQIDPAED